MYFLSHLLLSGAVVTAQDVDKTASTPNSANDTLKTSTAPVESIKTVSVTVTRTLYPAKTYPIPSYQPPTAKSSHVDVPPSLTHEGQQGGPPSPTGDTSDFLAGPIYQYASLASAKLHTASCAPYYPGASLTGQREFTFDTALVASTTIPFEGHFTPITGLTTKSMCEHRSTATSLSTSPAAPTIPYPTPTRSSVGYDSNPAQPTAPDETMDITPISTPTDNDFDILPPPDAEETMGILPLPTERLVHALPVTSASPTSSARTYSSSARPTDSSLLHSAPPSTTMGGFTWPTKIPNTDVDASDSSDNTQSSSTDNSTAWSGTDNAIPAQMHDPALQARTLPWLSPPPVHSASAAVQRVRRFWHDVFLRRENVGFVNDTNEWTEKKGNDGMEEKRDCKPCADEGKVLCQGDVAIGYCRGGCEELQFLGRGPGSGCTSNGTVGMQVEVRSAVAMVAALLCLRFAF
jgi:hypothetical protein